MAKIDCKLIAENIQQEIISDASIFFRKPKLATILVGERIDSQTYVRNKEIVLEKVGFEYETFVLPESITQEKVESLIKDLAINDDIDGILIQLPLPDHLDADKLISLIPYYKDVDGLTESNQGKLIMGKDWNDFIQPCTPLGIIKILDESLENTFKIYDAFNKKKSMVVAVIGRSNLLGNPLAQMLMRKDYTVVHMHSKSDLALLKDIKPKILCLCTGQKNLLTAYDISKYDLDAYLFTIIDAGIIRDEKGLRGDFKKEDYDILEQCDINYTSVPGGVGVLTTTILAYNLAKCFKLHNKKLENKSLL